MGLVGVAEIGRDAGQISVGIAEPVSGLLEPTPPDEPLGAETDALVQEPLQGALADVEAGTEVVDAEQLG